MDGAVRIDAVVARRFAIKFSSRYDQIVGAVDRIVIGVAGNLATVDGDDIFALDAFSSVVTVARRIGYAISCSCCDGSTVDGDVASDFDSLCLCVKTAAVGIDLA